MQLLNILPILIVLLIQGEAGYANTVKPVNTITNFGCAGCVPNYYAAGCVKWGPTGPRSTDVSLIMAPWNPRKSAYDCSLADPEYYRASCCAENFYVTNVLTVTIWKAKCRNIDGSEIKGY
ncbi:hypothetical protein PSTG_07936 [Puccinia striiformis f. sp. tritici PST-78]|uniref:Secreted protein n=1 Tax=Puccinia striiformis f. sp. tritici PST-78 TaxID=1165861 RepID=A0A0L0VIB9_9BASI|nr:hypothetical protein PSTG_07936 [Puccinia striiformis f. sp. tritici PST-78]